MSPQGSRRFFKSSSAIASSLRGLPDNTRQGQAIQERPVREIYYRAGGPLSALRDGHHYYGVIFATKAS
jgi:hypothetical protein